MFSDPLFFPMDRLETGRLILRKMTMHDADDVFDYSRDPDVARHVLWEPHRSLGDSRAYLRYMIRKYRSGEPASWGIVLKQDGKLIGTIGYMWHQGDNSATELGYSLARPYWGQGYMTEALRAVIAYSFEELRINRLEAQFEVGNPASGAVMRKAGMQREGLMRQRLYNKGRYVDVELYAILREDYVRMVGR